MEAKAVDEEEKIQQFVDILGEPASQARQFLEATAWDLEEAMQLYFAEGIENGVSSLPPAVSLPSTSASEVPSTPVPVVAKADSPPEVRETYVRPPLPVKREVLYDDFLQYRAHRMAQAPPQPTSVDAFRNFEDEANQRASNWGSVEPTDSSSSGLRSTKDSLAALYRPPFVLMLQGTFEQAKAEAARQGKWLLVNLQSTKEFSSYTLNRDTWAHEAVKETISMSFIFWQVYDDTEEGRKVCTYYKLLTMPTTLVLDPLTGQKMRAWEGMISPERLLEDLVPYLDRSPMERQPPAFPPQKRPRETASHPVQVSKEVEKYDIEEEEEFRQALAASLEGISHPVSDIKESRQQSKVQTKGEVEATPRLPVGVANKKRELPILPEEPAANSPSLCKVAVRFPDGRRAQRRFLQSDPIQYLWSFASNHVPEAANGRSFRLTEAIPGAPPLDYNSTTTISEAGLGNSMLAMSWD